MLAESTQSYLSLLGYENLCERGGVICGTFQFAHTWGLMVGLDHAGYTRRYCYQTHADMLQALATYTDLDQHPTGPWIKCKGRFRGELVDLLNPDWSKQHDTH